MRRFVTCITGRAIFPLNSLGIAVFIFGDINYERTKDLVMPITPRLVGR